MWLEGLSQKMTNLSHILPGFSSFPGFTSTWCMSFSSPFLTFPFFRACFQTLFLEARSNFALRDAWSRLYSFCNHSFYCTFLIESWTLFVKSLTWSEFIVNLILTKVILILPQTSLNSEAMAFFLDSVLYLLGFARFASLSQILYNSNYRDSHF